MTESPDRIGMTMLAVEYLSIHVSCDVVRFATGIVLRIDASGRGDRVSMRSVDIEFRYMVGHISFARGMRLEPLAARLAQPFLLKFGIAGIWRIYVYTCIIALVTWTSRDFL